MINWLAGVFTSKRAIMQGLVKTTEQLLQLQSMIAQQQQAIKILTAQVKSLQNKDLSELLKALEKGGR